MIDNIVLNQFTKEANKGRGQFCVWKSCNNYFKKNEKTFNSCIKEGLFGIEEAIKNNCQYKNFWGIVIPSIQHGWILSIARLIDPAYFRGNKKESRLSIYYILDLLDDETLKIEILRKLDRQKSFFDSIKNIRNELLAHNSVVKSSRRICAGIETFFEQLDDIIKTIKNKYPHLRECNDINLEYTEKLSETGVMEIFEKLVQ